MKAGIKHGIILYVYFVLQLVLVWYVPSGRKWCIAYRRNILKCTYRIKISGVYSYLFGFHGRQPFFPPVSRAVALGVLDGHLHVQTVPVYRHHLAHHLSSHWEPNKKTTKIKRAVTKRNGTWKATYEVSRRREAFGRGVGWGERKGKSGGVKSVHTCTTIQ